jgi:hypothetical protein
VDVDEPGSDSQATRIDLFGSTRGDPFGDLRDASAADGDVSFASRGASAIEDRAAPNNEIVCRPASVCLDGTGA